jgi:protein-disulfide isomerase
MASRRGSKKKRPRGKKAAEARSFAVPEDSGAPNRLGVIVSVIGLAALTVAVAIVGRPEKAPSPSEQPAPEAAATMSALERWQAAPARDLDVPEASFTRGPENASVTVVEFSDFECPFCREASRALSEIEAQYEGELRLVFRDFPLDTSCNGFLSQQMHPLACRAARLARCAGAQDAFWPAHDALFALDALTEAALGELPARLGLDEAALAACMTSERTAAGIQSDIEAGRELDVTGTPTLFVNGRASPSYGVDDLRSILNHVLSSP